MSVSFPDGTAIQVSYSGHVNLFNSITLDNILYVPKFHYSLLSVSKLVNSFAYNIINFHGYCIIQDPLIKRLIIVGKEEGGLYKLNQLSFYLTEINNYLHNIMNVISILKPMVNTMLSMGDINKESLLSSSTIHQCAISIVDMHNRLGHASIGKLRHIKGMTIKDTSAIDCKVYP